MKNKFRHRLIHVAIKVLFTLLKWYDPKELVSIKKELKHYKGNKHG